MGHGIMHVYDIELFCLGYLCYFIGKGQIIRWAFENRIINDLGFVEE
jgi:hypothetical protein